MKPKFIFKKIRDIDNEFDTTDVVFRSYSEVLPDVLQDFEDFLRGCGYSLKGVLLADLDNDDNWEDKNDKK